MDSKGDVKQFFGMRFAWHGLESCCCSGVSEPASKGLAPMVSELRPQLRCRNQPRTEGAGQKNCFFMGSKGNGKLCRDDVGATSDLAISAREICFLWIPKVT